MIGEVKLIARADGAEQTIVLKPGAKYPVQPNTTYKLVVDNQPALPAGTKVIRQGNNLVIKFADGETIELVDWSNTLNSYLSDLNGAQAWSADAANFVSVSEIESGVGTLANAEGQSLGLLGETDLGAAAASTPAAAAAPAAAAMSPGAIAAIALGAAAAAGAGGGGGGGGGGDSSPVAAPTIALDDNSNTGSKTDSITSVDLPLLTGTAPAGATVRVTLPGETLEAVADANGAWSVQTTQPLAEGDTQVSAVAVAGGRTSNATQLVVTVDKAAPDAPTIAPDMTDASDKGVSNTDDLTSESRPAFSGSGGQPGDTAVLIANGNVVGTAEVAADGTFTVTPDDPLPEGAYEIAFAFRDAAGNQSAAGTQTLVVNLDLTPPSGSPGATPDMATASDSGASNIDNITSKTQPVFTGVGTGQPGAALALLADGVQIGSTTVAGDGSYSVAPSAPMANGKFNVTVAFTDPAGNVSTPSSALVVVIDTVAPLAQAPGLADASDGGLKGDNRTNDSTPTIQGTGVPGDTVTVDFPVPGGQTVQAIVNSNGVWTATPSVALADGARTITLSAVDPAGNSQTGFAPYVVNIDTGVPNAPAILAVPENSGGGINATEAADGTIVQVDLAGTGAVAGDRIVVNWNGRSASYTLSASDITAGKADAVVSATVLQNAGNGTFNISAQVEDAAGNQSNASALFPNVTVNGVPPPAPGAALAAGSDSGDTGDNRTNDSTPTITGTSLAGTTVTLVTAKETLTSAVVGGGGIWSLTPTQALDEGSNNLQITAKDAVGNVSSTTNLALVIDSTAPANLTVTPNMTDASDTGKLNSDNLTKNARPSFNAPAGTATPGDTVWLVLDGGSKIGSAPVLANGAILVSPSANIGDGAHNVAFQITDSAGNASALSPALPIVIDTVAPGAPSIASVPENDNGGINPTERADGTTVNINLNGTNAQAGDLLTLNWGAQTVTYTITADDATNKAAAVEVSAATINTQGANGAVDITAKLTDGAGNVSATSATFSATVDSTGPGAPSVAVPESSGGGINVAEKNDGGGTTVNVGLTGTGAVAGDTVVVSWGTQTVNYTLQQSDINAASAAVTVPSAAIDAQGSGNVDVTAVINDQPGNAGTASAPITVAVDLLVPAAPGLGGGTGLTTATPTVNGTSEANAAISLFDTDGTTLVGGGTADGSGAWSITISSPLSAGQHTIKAKQTDAAGNVSDLSSSGVLVSVSGGAPTSAESQPLQLQDLLSDGSGAQLVQSSGASLAPASSSLSSLLDEQPIAPSL